MKNPIGPKGNKGKFTRKLQIIGKNTPFQYVEAYNSLRTNVNFITASKGYKKILITSSIPEEGKSNVSVNLAVSLAAGGKRVVLIDCDLRKPVIHKYLRISRKNVGLTNVLSGSTTLDDAIIKFSDLNIYVLTAGVVPPNPSELLEDEKMNKLIDLLAEQFDYVLLDTPPVSVVTDAAVLGHFTDGAILVVRSKYTPIEAAQLAKKRLTDVNVKILGVVLNGYDMKKSSKRNGYDYTYDYYKE